MVSAEEDCNPVPEATRLAEPTPRIGRETFTVVVPVENTMLVLARTTRLLEVSVTVNGPFGLAEAGMETCKLTVPPTGAAVAPVAARLMVGICAYKFCKYELNAVPLTVALV